MTFDPVYLPAMQTETDITCVEDVPVAWAEETVHPRFSVVMI
jgi:hypothetical protein